VNDMMELPPDGGAAPAGVLGGCPPGPRNYG
jgi:hypothetical protein